MSLGLLNNIAAIYANNNLNNTQASLQNTLTQLSSGSRINTGADDAAGLAVADGLHANEAALTQSAQNAQQGIGLLQTADGALSQVTNLLNRAVTLATEAANTTLNSSQVSSANQEYQNIIAEIGAIGSTTNYNGNSVFSGTATTLFVSDGTASGANVYNDVVGALSSGSVGLSTGVVQPATLTPGASSALAPAAGVTPTAVVAGTVTLTAAAATNTINGAFSITEAGGGTTVSIASANLSLATFVSTFNTASTAASSDLVATLSGAVVTITGGIGAARTLATTGTAVTQNVLGTSALALGTPSTPTTTGGSSTSVTLNSTADAFAGIIKVAVAGGTALSFTVATGTTGTALASQLTENASFKAAGVSASFATSTGILTITGPKGTTNTLSTTGSALTEVSGPVTPGAGIDFTASAISTLTSDSAKTVLTSVTSAIADVAFQRGILGANINELTAASNVASSESENLTSAESNIRSTNYGQATSDLAKYQVLSQTGISALAQANSVQQEILKLLQ